jgi:phage internal scaffolding protein
MAAFQKGRHGPTKRVTLDTGKGLTEQSHKDECDINFILRDYQRTGFMKHAKEHQGKYDDISVQDFQEAMFIVANANSMFAELPGQVRKRFDNNPSHFLNFVQNPDNKAEMETMGILRGNDGIDMNGVATNAPIVEQEVVAPPPVEPPAEPV